MSLGHSPWGASQYSRWGVCPGSIKLSEGIESNSSVYAAEGTIAHEIAAELLLGRMPPVVGKKRIQDGHEIEITDEMMEAVEVYVDHIQDLIRDKEGNLICETFVEQEFHLKDIHDNLWGTSDFTAYYEESKFLRVFDYKHGAGVPVEVENNKQAKYYALGSLLQLAKEDKIVSRVEVGIIQPRCPHPDGVIRTHEFDAIELIDFGAQLLEDVEATLKDDAPIVAGDHCRWCPAAAICPKLKNKAQEIAKQDFGAGSTLTEQTKMEQLPALLKWLPIIEAWTKNVRHFAYEQAKAGKRIEGWKLVEKRGKRDWVDEDELCKFMSENYPQFGEKDLKVIKDPVLKSPAQIEKLRPEGVKVKDFKNSLQDFVKSVSSGTTLVPADDKRQEVIEGPKQDFKPVNNQSEDIFS